MGKDHRSEPLEDPPDLRLVVGVAASAGGLTAYKELVAALTPGDHTAFVFVQHLDPAHQSLTASILSPISRLPVTEVDDGEKLQPDHIYIIPPNRYLSIQNGHFRLQPPENKASIRLPIDAFFGSLAEQYGARGVAIVLTGTGSDGSSGLRHVNEAGGIVIAQDPETAEFDGMPRSAVRTGLCDFVTSIAAIPNILIDYANHPYTLPSDSSLTDTEKFLASINTILQTTVKHNFRSYKQGTVLRRVQRRMGLRSIEDPSAYLDYLRQERSEAQQLYRDLLIGVTSFFRDAAAFDELADVLKAQLALKKSNESCRVWVPGCSTGEEAYSIAMLIESIAESLGTGVQAQIFATDVDDAALEIARQGRYSRGSVASVPPRFLKQFFSIEADEYRVSQTLRERVVFAVQDLVTDAPFSRLDLVSCRNVLIYLNSETQDHLLAVFHFALAADGYLFLGSTESTSRVTNLYTPISRKWRLFQKLGSSALAGRFPIRESSLPPARETVRARGVETMVNRYEIARDALLRTFAPVSVLIDEHFQIDYFHGETTEFLNLPSGEPTRNLLDMARDGLRTRLRAAVHRAAKENRVVQTTTRRMRRNGHFFGVRVTVQPINITQNQKMFLVSFAYTEGKAQPSEPVELIESEDLAMRQLEDELRATREDLQSTIEELEASNEELRAANEEVMSMNEETQSSNEELETSREELQSLNEELTTLNNQLEEKLHELETANDDLANLLISTDIAMIFLDLEGRIRSFTPETSRLLNVIPADVGRPLMDLAPKVEDPALSSDVENVLANLTTVEANVTCEDRAYIRRTLPYRTRDNRIAGVAIAYSDVTDLQNALSRAEIEQSRQIALARLTRRAVFDELDALFRLIVDTAAENVAADAAELWTLAEENHHLRLTARSAMSEEPAAQALSLVDDAAIASVFSSEEAQILTNIPLQHRPAWEPFQQEGTALRAIMVPVTTNAGCFGVIAIYRLEGNAFTSAELEFAQSIASALTVFIERSRYQFEIMSSEALLREIMVEMGMSFATIGADGRYEFASAGYAEFLDATTSEIIGQRPEQFWTQTSNEVIQPYIQQARAGKLTAFEHSGFTRRGRLFEAKVSIIPRKTAQDLVTGLHIAALDLTAIKQAEANRALTEASEEERRRIGQELHTSVGQSLTGLAMIAESTAVTFEKADGDVAAKARRLSEGITDVLEDVRRIARGLDVVSENLVGELQALANETAAIEGLDCTFCGSAAFKQPSDATAASLYRIAQEALANAVRHAAASSITISLEADSDWLTLRVADDGAGPPPEARRPDGMGLRIMRYRTEMLRGNLKIESVATGGTQVVCRIPLEETG